MAEFIEIFSIKQGVMIFSLVLLMFRQYFLCISDVFKRSSYVSRKSWKDPRAPVIG